MKKAQIQSGETIVVIIITSIMIIIGLVYATKSKTDRINEESENIKDINAMTIALTASNLNELKCSEYNTLVKTCLDYYRILAFNETLGKNKQGSKEYYYSAFGNSKITINILEETTSYTTKETITIYNYNNSLNKSSTPIS